MKTRIMLPLSLAVVLLAGLASSVFSRGLREEPRWRPLFDGKSLAGWEHVGPGKFLIEDGTMRTEGGMGILWYPGEKFHDCVIRVVYKLSGSSANSGIHIRVADRPVDEWTAVHRGYEVQISEEPDADDWHRTGSIYSMSPATAKASKPPGEWNTMEITLKGNRVLITLNGVPVQNFDPATASIPERKKDYEPIRGPRPEAGFLGLQNHASEPPGTYVSFKDVSVRPL